MFSGKFREHYFAEHLRTERYQVSAKELRTLRRLVASIVNLAIYCFKPLVQKFTNPCGFKISTSKNIELSDVEPMSKA